jgi:LysM repeat protein
VNHFFQKLITSFFLIFGLIFILPVQVVSASGAGSRSQEISPPTPGKLIEAVNQLRLENGLNTLNAHPALMQAAQWEADVINNGAPGHTHPPGLTLGQWLISLGYPLAGDISQDGLRSENWTAGTELTVDEAIQQWLGDAPHTNTMLSSARTDIGAGVAVRTDSQGKPIYTLVIETAMQTSSGEQQWEADQYLTSVPGTQSDLYGDATQAAAAAQVSQYISPVVVGTARPDGDVVHQVQQGQTLWAIAVAYGVRIDEIKRLNNLTDNEVWLNQELLIQKGATQPVPTVAETAAAAPVSEQSTPLPTATAELRTSETPVPLEATVSASAGANTTLTIFIILVVLVGGALVLVAMRENRRDADR